MDLVHGTLSIKSFDESFAPSGVTQPGGGQGKISVKERETGNGESTASSLLSEASRWNFRTGVRYKPFKAADEKVPLSVVHVNNKPQYLVFWSHFRHQLSKQRRFPVESSKQPCKARG
jgi:hypothetical protein